MTEEENAWQADDTSVRVALRIRPQSAKERIDMCRMCTSVTPGEPQVLIGNDKSFTYDYVFDIESTQDIIYNNIARALVDGTFDGYNATIFAYGQTGSGKTYTMGTGFDVEQEEETVGIIPRAVGHLFHRINQCKRESISESKPAPDFKVNAQFMELYNEEIIDLLDTTRDPSEKGKYKSHIKIHEDAEGGIYTVGVTTRPVHSLEDTIQCLKLGALSRTTASTNMNATSSRSHAIFTLHIKQQRIVNTEEDDSKSSSETSEQQTFEFETLSAKFHFVDLAGSERLKRTGAIGERAKEGISINCGLLALGNVISALGDKAKKGSHVPYRDSKLTRLLQDSLGGNSRTLMIACISPSDRDFMETLNTLKYANRARNIKNKVSVNQDKTSRQIAALRQQVTSLMEELAEYKQGKRLVDADGVESVNDMFHENTMLQTEIQSLRARVKALQDTVDGLKKQLTNQELNAVTAIASEGGEEVAKIVEGYITEIQELRAKLLETESALKRSSTRMGSRGPPSPMIVPMSSNYNLNVSQSAESADLNSLLSLAKKDLHKLKKEKKRLASQGSDKENETETLGNISEEEKQDTEKQEQDLKSTPDDQSDDEANGEADELEDGEVSSETESDESDSDSESDMEFDSENIHEDLATITCEISIKETLIEELEKSQRRLHSLKSHYEDKLLSLQARIKETEIERDKVMMNIGNMESTSHGEAKKMKDQYEKKLNDMKSELKKLNAAKKEHSKLMRNQSQYETQLKTLQRDLGEMKKAKVKLMNRMKEESQKSRQTELKKNKEIAQLRKQQRSKEHAIKVLEADKRQKEAVYKRKMEEIESLKRRQRPLSSRAAGRVAQTSRQSDSSYYGRRKKKEFSPKAAKQKWDNLNKEVTCIVTKKQTLAHMEKYMERWMKDREKKGKRLDKLLQKRDKLQKEEYNEAEMKDVTDQISTVTASIDFAQDNITECQTNIMQLEEETKEEESFSKLSVGTLEEAKYLLEHFMNLAIGKGLLAAQKEDENRELVAQMEQEKLELMFNRDMLHYLIKDQVDIAVDLPDFGSREDELLSGASSTSNSPIDSRLENQFQPINPGGILLAPPGGGEAPAYSKKDKARRKTATPEDLLYANAGPSESTCPLLPVIELPGERTDLMLDDDDTMSVDSLMMPAPRHLPSNLLRQNANHRSASSTQKNTPVSPGPSPGLGGRKFPNRTVPSDEKRKSQTSSSSTSSVEGPPTVSTNNVEELTPPSSPMTTRRVRDENVFSRLTSNSQPSSPSPNRGSIHANVKPVISKSSPLTCTHFAEGHTKAILSVYATEDLLFSSSKDRTAKVWDLETGEEVLSLAGHPNNVTAVRYSEESHLIYTVSTYFVKVWDIRDTKRSIKTLVSSGLSSDGTSHEPSSRQINCPPGETAINDMAINSTGSVVYTAAGNSVRIWDIRSFKAVGRLSGGRQSAVMVVAVDDTDTADGNICVVTGSKDHYIKIFEMSEDTVGVLSPKYNLEPPHYDGIQSLCLMGDLLFSGSRDTCIKKWDLSEHELNKSINNAHKDWITGLTFAPGGDCLLSGCRGGYLKLWNIDTCQCMGEIKAHSSPINAIATNNKCIFSASNDNTIGIWQLQSGVEDGGLDG